MKFTKQSLIALAFMAGAGNANAAFLYFAGSDSYYNTFPSSVGNIVIPTTSSAAALNAWTQEVNTTLINGQSLSISTFETNYSNVSTATGLTFPQCNSCDRASESFAGNNVNLSVNSNTGLQNSDTGGIATFSATAGNPSFKIETFETSNGNKSGVFFNDIPNGNDKTLAQKEAFTDVLSIGKFNGFDTDDTNQYDNDNFALEVTDGPGLYAFAFNMVNNRSGTGEWLEVFADRSKSGTIFDNGGDDNLAFFGDSDGVNAINGDIPSYSGPYPAGDGTVDNFAHVSFVGIVATSLNEVFKFLEFNEDGSSNDIGIFNLRFASLDTAAVPVPAAVWLFGSGLLALLGLRRKKLS